MSETHATTSERFYASLGMPVPAPLTPAEAAEFEREMDEADQQVSRRYATREHALPEPPVTP